MFWLFLELGFEHISDLNGYDHILFLIAIAAVYIFYDLKRVLILITAFTIGHSLTLALAVTGSLIISSSLVEFLIPVTIFISAIADFFYKGTHFTRKMSLFKYFSALFFGLIHGLGFSNYLRAILGEQQNIFGPLLAFNLGLEIGQMFIVFILLLVSTFFVNILKLRRKYYVYAVSAATAAAAVFLIIERVPF